MTTNFSTEGLLSTTVAQIVANHHRAADVFRQLGINYCCSGGVGLADACAHKGLDVDIVVNQLAEACRPIQLPPNLSFQNWTLHFLTDYIVNIHHSYLKTILPQLEKALIQFVNGHQKKWPSLQPLPEHFQNLSIIVQTQMVQEENNLFPYIKHVERARLGNESYGRLLVKTLRKPLQEDNNEELEQALIAIRNTTQSYNTGEGICTNHAVLLKQLKELDDDLVQHKHLENNILFPRAAEMEVQLMEPELH